MGNQIAQAAVGRTMNEPLLGHPEIVVHLREIFVPGVGDECDDAFRFRLLPAIA